MPDSSTTPIPPHAPVTVHLLRHGLVHNPSGILYGRLPDFHLSESGRAMAEAVAKHLADADVTHLVSSPLERAVETAEPLASTIGLEIVTDERLIEPTNQFEGTRFAVGDGVLKRPQNWSKVRDPFTPSWGEPYLRIAHRMLGAIYDAAHRATGHEAVLVSHQLPIWTVRRYLEGKRLWHNPAKRRCGLASLTSLTFANGVLARIGYSEPAASLVPESAAGATGA